MWAAVTEHRVQNKKKQRKQEIFITKKLLPEQSFLLKQINESLSWLSKF